MTSRQPSTFVSKFQAAQKRPSSCPPIVFFSWATILLWVGFLVYCVHYGLITSTQISVMVENADILASKKSLRTGDTTLSPDGNQLPHPDTPTNQPPPTPTNHAHFYTVFSTDCTPYQDWQSIFLFHSALRVKQPGIITRIASGCDQAQQEHLTTLYKTLYGDYCTVHFTPDFKKDAQSQRSYDFYNKPWGIKHWLEYANPPIPEDAIIALLDPDMVFLRPLTPVVAGSPYIVRRKFPMTEMIEEVGEGRPVSQTYGLGMCMAWV
ncbi:hypothetical protein EON65_32015 [archaeon]|nr:MAG: hypothetical protein EON65_32015 [archaeon]